MHAVILAISEMTVPIANQKERGVGIQEQVAEPLVINVCVSIVSLDAGGVR